MYRLQSSVLHLGRRTNQHLSVPGEAPRKKEYAHGDLVLCKAFQKLGQKPDLFEPAARLRDPSRSLNQIV